MDWNDPSWVRKSVLTQFVDTFENEDRGALITFTKVANKVSDFTSDKTKLINKIDSLKNDSGYNSYSGTDGSAGLNEAKDVFENSKRSSNKYLVLLTDGEDTQTSYSYDTYIDYAGVGKI